MKPRTIAIIGERNLAHRSHQGIEASLEIFRRTVDPTLTYSWIGTAAISAGTVDGILRNATGVWCAPGSPYENTAGALRAIRHARMEKKTFLGTCGGFQHALMEFAQNVLGREAAHQELDPAARNPLIIKLSCSLVGAKGKVIATSTERFAGLLGGPESIEEFHCNYGFNGDLAKIFQGSGLAFVAHDESGQVRAFRLEDHPFYVGTLFQPERRALGGSLHPVVEGFLRAA
jgi:CTP synthase (UTP-ammonia lyase)